MTSAAASGTMLHSERASAWIDRANPVSLIAAALILSVPLFASIDVVSAVVAIVLELALMGFTGLTPATVGRRLLPIAVFAPIAGISMLLYATPGGEVYWSFLFATISSDSITLAIAVTLRVLALGLPTILLFSRVDPTRLADALAQVAHLPSRFVLGILAGTRMLGLFVDDWRSLALARRTRGLADTGMIRRTFSMAFVLLVFAVRRGSKLSTAMEARGFGSSETRSWARPSTLGRADAIVIAVAVAVMALAVGSALWAGTFRFVGS